MSTNKQALREAAEKAISEEGETWWNEDQLASDYGLALHRTDAKFIAAANPATVLALLDELDKWQQESSTWKSVTEKQLAIAIEAEKRIAELEARTPYGYLRQCDGQIQISIGREQPHNRSGGYATPWFAIYTAAGISVKGE